MTWETLFIKYNLCNRKYLSVMISEHLLLWAIPTARTNTLWTCCSHDIWTFTAVSNTDSQNKHTVNTLKSWYLNIYCCEQYRQPEQTHREHAVVMISEHLLLWAIPTARTNTPWTGCSHIWTFTVVSNTDSQNKHTVNMLQCSYMHNKHSVLVTTRFVE
jgi:hypothetical protein